MAELNESVWINAKPEDVWPFLVEPEKLLQWLTEMQTFEWTEEGPLGTGSRYYVMKKVRGQVRRYDSEVTQWNKNRVFGFTSETLGFSRVEGEWEVAPEGAGCRFTMREKITVQKANWLVDRLFVQPNAVKAVCGFQAQLKRLVENQADQQGAAGKRTKAGRPRAPDSI